MKQIEFFFYKGLFPKDPKGAFISSGEFSMKEKLKLDLKN
jgi:hypothetical protein